MADIEIGGEIPSLTVDVPVEKMKTVAALLNDSNPIHWDVAAVERLGMGDRPVNQGPNNMAYVCNMLIAWAGGDAGAVRRLTVRFLGNVFGGERVTARGRVTGIRVDGSARIADLDVWLERSEDDRVLDGTASVVVG